MARFENYPFRSEAEASEFLDNMRWPNGISCPACASPHRPIYDMSRGKGVASARHPEGRIRHGLRRCGGCGLELRATYNTPFQGVRVPLDVLLAVIVLHDKHGQKHSIAALSRQLGIKRDTVSRLWEAAATNESLRRLRVQTDDTISIRSLSLEPWPQWSKPSGEFNSM